LLFVLYINLRVLLGVSPVRTQRNTWSSSSYSSSRLQRPAERSTPFSPDRIPTAFSSAPVLHQWIPDRPIIIKTDASDYALAAILSIELESGEIHPVAFHSQKFNSTELNYDVHYKELYAIFEAFRIWRHYLKGSATPIDVVTDHKNLEYFATTKLLNRQQA
jgi:hypothetical protein